MMKGKTVSAHVDIETAERITSLSKRENRSLSQMASASIKLGSLLPPNAWSVLLQLINNASKTQWQDIAQDITRVLLNHQYKLAEEKISKNIDPEWLETLKTQDDILSASIEFTRDV